ncbi:MAG: hypothetical protein RL708_2173, partial [Bacteroidota bacterium]
MNISSNSLFHFSKSLEVLLSILNDKFYGSYCKETFFFNSEKSVLGIPKISFCDIPLTAISNTKQYGEYGIGMKKEWAKRKKLNPVMYLEKDSLISETVVSSINGLHNITSKMIKPSIDSANEHPINVELYKSMLSGVDFTLDSICFIKPYEEDLERDGMETIKNHRFYDEREWCYIPLTYKHDKKLIVDEDYYNNWRNKSDKKELLKDFVFVDFNFD